MSWSEAAIQLSYKATKSIHINNSNIWKQIKASLKRIETEMNMLEFESMPNAVRINMMLKQTDAWIMHAKYKSVYQIIKSMLFYLEFNTVDWLFCSGYFINMKYTKVRNQFMTLLLGAITFHATCNEQFDFSFANNIRNTGYYNLNLDHIAIITEFFDNFKSIDDELFWQTYYLSAVEETAKLRLGFVMVFCSKYIESTLKNQTETELQQRLALLNKQIISTNRILGRTASCFYISNVSKELVYWRNNVEKVGLYMVKDGITDIHKTGLGGLNFLFGKLRLRNNKMLEAQEFFVKAIYEASSFVLLTLSLRYLSDICHSFNQFAIGFRLLKCAYLICVNTGEYITPSFIKNYYRKKKKLFVTELNRMSCMQCGAKEGKLKSCTGCMKNMYCDRKCQKKHWNHIHRYQCNKLWIVHYNLLKSTVVLADD
eukprot:390277_1